MRIKVKQMLVMLMDVLSIQLSVFLSMYIRFDGEIGSNTPAFSYIETYLKVLITITIIKLVILYIMKMYTTLWKYASITEMIQVIFASVFSTLAFMGYMFIMRYNLPRSIYILTFIFDSMLFGGVRLSYRIMRAYRDRSKLNKSELKKVLVIGAGQAGAIIIKELRTHLELRSRPIALIDDDLTKIGKTLNGVPIVGTRYSIREIAYRENISQIIIAIPSATKTVIRDIVSEASETECELKIVPGMFELIDGKIDITTLRNVEISDLLGRDEVYLNTDEMNEYVTDRCILVTGGGGSIGSELCRQIAGFSPSRLLILDIYENNAFALEQELRKQYPDLELMVIIASVRDQRRIFKVVEEYRPHIIFHAAAHKHVPLMEENPNEAIKNNVFGSYNVIEAAKKYSVNRFVLISTDKAVNPTNVMGASKRIAELMVQSQKHCSTTKFVAVRFGNVLGSNGSVIPTFQNQIRNGGPVTVTHPEIQRYFMTIPEASRLVLQASSFGENSEIFVLDMGEPVLIKTLAENLIRLSGLKPYEDIDIKYTGLRPGEKMFEELILNEENASKTKYDKIFIEHSEITDDIEIEDILDELRDSLSTETNDIREVLKKYIPTFNYEFKE